LQNFFHDGWKHKRIDMELERMMRVSEKRAIAGQKGGLGSALSRMKLENSPPGRPVPRAIASICSSRASANVDHSHSHSHQTLSSDVATGEASTPAPSTTKSGKASIPISAELAALMARKS
jgi:hypothetical protein